MAKKSLKKPAPKKKTSKTKTPPKTQKRPTPQADEIVKFVLRIPGAIHTQVKANAADKFCSMNEYITQVLSRDIQNQSNVDDLIKLLKDKKVL